MRHIRSLADLLQLENCLSVPRIYDVVTSYFYALAGSMDLDSTDSEFVLDSGHIVLVEACDSEESLSRLTDSWPEFAETVSLDTCTFLKVVVMEDNDFFMTYFLHQGDHPDIDAWVQQFLA